MDYAQEPPLEMGEDGIEDRRIEVPPLNMTNDQMKLDAFMAEMVEVMVHETNEISTDPGASVLVTLRVNGIPQHMVRGVPTTIRRYHLEALARARTTALNQTEAQINNGLLPSSNSMPSYPFSVVNDTPAGITWLKRLQAQPA